MDQSEALSVIYSLIPQMVGKDPSGVLIKYAADNGLAPAQLQRLGYVFNQAMTNEMLTKDRNGVPHTLDVVKMASDFIGVTGRGKRASSFFDTTSPSEGGQQKAASAEVKITSPQINRDRVPETWHVPERGFVREVEKQAKDRTRDAFWLSVKVANVALEEYTCSNVQQATVVNHIARAISKQANPSMQLAMLSADAKHYIPGEESAIDEVVTKIAAAVGKEASRHLEITAPSSVFQSDRTGMVEKLRESISHGKEASFAIESLMDAVETAGQTGTVLASDPQIARAATKLATEVERLGKPLGLFKESSAAPNVVNGPWGGRASDDLGALAGSSADQAISSARSGEGTLPFLAHAGAAGVHQAGNIAQTGRQLLFRDAPAAVREFTQQGTVGQMLDDTARKNQARADSQLLDRDRIAKDTESVAKLQRILIEDEILSKKDPEKVFQAFMTIRNSSPEVAGDEGLLKLMLRHSLETQGVDIDTASAARKYEFGGYKKDLPSRGPAAPSSESNRRPA